MGLIERVFGLIEDTNGGLRREVEAASLVSRRAEEMVGIVARARERAAEGRRVEMVFGALVEPVVLSNYLRYRSWDAWSGLLPSLDDNIYITVTLTRASR